MADGVCGRNDPSRILKGKQVQDLCELVTVSKEHALFVSQDAIQSLGDREGRETCADIRARRPAACHAS